LNVLISKRLNFGLNTCLTVIFCNKRHKIGSAS